MSIWSGKRNHFDHHFWTKSDKISPPWVHLSPFPSVTVKSQAFSMVFCFGLQIWWCHFAKSEKTQGYGPCLTVFEILSLLVQKWWSKWLRFPLQIDMVPDGHFCFPKVWLFPREFQRFEKVKFPLLHMSIWSGNRKLNSMFFGSRNDEMATCRKVV